MEKFTYRGKFKPESERGATLLEFLFAISIFSVVALGIFSNITNVMRSSKMNEVAPAVYEKDQVVRYEIVTTMDYFQRELIVNDCPDKNNNNILEDSEILFCTNPSDKLKASQQNFTFPRAVYWGNKADLELEQYVRGTIEDFDKLVGLLTDRNTNKRKSELLSAIEACKKSSFDINTTDIAERNSYFICGFGRDIVVQLKVNFWDFLSGKPSKCKDLNARPGRGVQAVYRFFHIAPYYSEGKKLYQIANYSSKLFIPKKVDSNFIPSRNLWDESSQYIKSSNNESDAAQSETKPDYMKNCRA